MIRFLPVCVIFICIASPVLGQETARVTNFTITELEAGVASLPLPSLLRADLAELLDLADRFYARGAGLSAVPFLEQFAEDIESQPANVVPPERGSELALKAGMVAEALRGDLMLGGAGIGPDGGVIEVADPNSPVFGARLTIPAGALSEQQFVSMSVVEDAPPNGLLTFFDGGLALGPAGLELATPATLSLQYDDLAEAGLVGTTGFSADALKVGAVDFSGRIAFPRHDLDRQTQAQTIQVYDFASYWRVAWRWPPGVVTYKLSWDAGGVAIAPGFGMDALADSVRSAVALWEAALEPAGVTFQEVGASEPAAIRFGFFSTGTPLSVLNAPVAAAGLVPGLARGLGDGAAQVYARENPVLAGEGFAVTFNSNFGSVNSGLTWTPDHSGNASAVSIEAVAIHALGHVLGLDDIPGAVQPPVMATGADLLRPEVCLSPEDVAALFELYRVTDPNAVPGCQHVVLDGLPEGFDFGSNVEEARTFTIQSTGTGTLNINSITAYGDFVLDEEGTSRSLRPGESTTFAVRFDPSEPGAREGVVRIVSNGRDSVIPVWLLGTGPYVLPECTLTPRPAQIVAGESSVLSWVVGEHPATASISGGVGVVPPESGTREVRPEATTRYALTVSNEAGSTTCDATLEVASGSSSDVLWTRQFGTVGDDVVRSVVSGEFGVLVAGEAGGTVSAPGEGFLSLYDTAGAELWERTVAGARFEGVTADATGIYVAGLMESASEVASDANVPNSAWDVVVQKYGFDGELLWTDQFGGEAADRASSIVAGTSGIYVAGVTEGTVGGPESFGGLDVFVIRYSPEGERLWSRQFGTPSDDYARDIEAIAGGVVVVGDTTGALEGAANSGGSDAYLKAYTFEGEELWSRQFGVAGSEFIASLAADETGFYVAGGVETALAGQVDQGGFDAFLRKYDWDGGALWTRQFGSELTDSAAAVGADASGVYVVGATEGTLPEQTGFGEFDAFVRAYDSSGEELWTRHLGTAGIDDVYAVSPYNVGLYVAGSTLGTFEGSDSSGATDAYLGKILK